MISRVSSVGMSSSFHWPHSRNTVRLLRTMTSSKKWRYACRTDTRPAAFQLHAQRADRWPGAWPHMP